jgi:UDP:flavonoid glycosyltransferase YjiC (YdhE family)
MIGDRKMKAKLRKTSRYMRSRPGPAKAAGILDRLARKVRR